jgi:hypothetical protein
VHPAARRPPPPPLLSIAAGRWPLVGCEYRCHLLPRTHHARPAHTALAGARRRTTRRGARMPASYVEFLPFSSTTMICALANTNGFEGLPNSYGASGFVPSNVMYIRHVFLHIIFT